MTIKFNNFLGRFSSRNWAYILSLDAPIPNTACASMSSPHGWMLRVSRDCMYSSVNKD